MLLGAFESCFGAVAIRLERVQPILENIIKVGHAVFDQTVEAFELLVCIRHFLLECEQAAIEALGFLGATG